jgi:hypothetical protein
MPRFLRGSLRSSALGAALGRLAEQGHPLAPQSPAREDEPEQAPCAREPRRAGNRKGKPQHPGHITRYIPER